GGLHGLRRLLEILDELTILWIRAVDAACGRAIDQRLRLFGERALSFGQHAGVFVEPLFFALVGTFVQALQVPGGKKDFTLTLRDGVLLIVATTTAAHAA